MDMFADFFRLNYLNSSDTSFQEKIFNDMEITKDKAFVEKYSAATVLFYNTSRKVFSNSLT